MVCQVNAELIYDISPVLCESLAVFPGDCAWSLNQTMDFAKKDSLRLSSMTGSLHSGAHADAPSHYHVNGEDIQRRDLNFYIGPCQVICVQMGPKERIQPHHIKDKVITSSRLLFRTDTFLDPNVWNGDFASLSPELVDDLAHQGVMTVGIDTPSIDLADDTQLLSHQRIYAHNMAILEGLVLEKISEGKYFLVAPPLKIQSGDAAPVRAVLLGVDEVR